MSDYNLDPNMSEDDASMLMANMIVDAKLRIIETQMPARLAETLKMPLEAITADYIDRLACAVYGTAITIPFAMIKVMGGPVRLSAMLLTSERSDVMSPAELTRKLVSGMAVMTPVAASKLTVEAITQAAKLCLLDWLDKGDALTGEGIENDAHFYISMLMERAGATHSTIRREMKEHTDNLSAEDYLALPLELRRKMEGWDWETDQPIDGE